MHKAMTTPREMPKDYAGFKAWIEETLPELEMPAFCENLRAAINAHDVVLGQRTRRVAQLKTRIVTLDDALFVAFLRAMSKDMVVPLLLEKEWVDEQIRYRTSLKILTGERIDCPRCAED